MRKKPKHICLKVQVPLHMTKLFLNKCDEAINFQFISQVSIMEFIRVYSQVGEEIIIA